MPQKRNPEGSNQKALHILVPGSQKKLAWTHLGSRRALVEPFAALQEGYAAGMGQSIPLICP